jgi:hypothetical protein
MYPVFLGVTMKKAIILGTAVIVLGLLISLGPQFLFKVCVHSEDSYPRCHWSAQAEIGIGILITALGTCMIVFTDLKTHMGLLIGTLLASLIALSIPNTLIGGAARLPCNAAKSPFRLLPPKASFCWSFRQL